MGGAARRLGLSSLRRNKAEFEKQGKQAASPPEKKPMPVLESAEDTKEMSALELSALCTNLARGYENNTNPRNRFFLEN